MLGLLDSVRHQKQPNQPDISTNATPRKQVNSSHYGRPNYYLVALSAMRDSTPIPANDERGAI
jgi:hypothetical protein